MNRATSGPITVAIFADLEGVLEPCGCTKRPAGGVDRLAHAMQELRKREPTLLIAAGQLFEPAVEPTDGALAATRTTQSLLKADSLVRILRILAPDAIVPSAHDWRFRRARLDDVIRGSETALAEPETFKSKRLTHTIREVSGFRVGLLSAHATSDAEVLALRQRGASLVIAFDHPAALGEGISARPSAADIVVQTGSDRASLNEHRGAVTIRPSRHAESLTLLRIVPKTTALPWRLISDRTRQLEPGEMRVTVLALDRSVPADPAVRGELTSLFETIDKAALRVQGDADKAHEPSAFAGARTCAACHTNAYLWWMRTPHARAYRTLEARHRAGDVACIACHVTGFGRPGGADFGRLDELDSVGCESCHGPGNEHADNPQIPVRTASQGVSAATCIACHDADHSDDFEFETKRQRLLVPGHGVHPK